MTNASPFREAPADDATVLETHIPCELPKNGHIPRGLRRPHLPHLVLLILVAFALGGGTTSVVLAVGLTHWPRLTRVLTALAQAIDARGGQRRARPYLDSQLRRLRRRGSDCSAAGDGAPAA